MITSFEDTEPQLGKNVFVASSALVLGDVALGDDCGVWYGAVIRGDVNYIRIGHSTNVQDQVVIHVATGTHPTHVGDQVTIGHAAVVHGCTIGNNVLVGIGAVIMDGAEVGEGSVVAAGSLVPPGKTFPSRSLVVGAPATRKREVTDDEIAWIQDSARHYVDLARRHAQNPLNR